MIKHMILTVAMAAAGVSLAHVARGQVGPDACAADVEKFCKDVAVGGGRRYTCLKEHEKELSEPCRKHVVDVQTKVRGIHEACWDDVNRLCSDVQRGRGRVLKCLKEHESELSDACKSAVQPSKQ